ncbi:MAG TPA: YdeI/OmpD-associated family protein [Candidatus Acidoferrum sp.]|nr:YdeI/OmpD-associated family protein [Candidatus Acidoferrum sp.]
MKQSAAKTKPKAASKAAPRKGTKKTLAPKSFKAALEHMQGNLGWVIVWIPFRVYKVWGSRGNFRVKGEINGFPFRTSLFPTRKGIHYLLVNKKMQAGANVFVGNTAEFFLEPDTAERIISTPPELQRLLAQDKSLFRWYDALSYSYRKWFSDSILQPRSPAARSRRAEQIAEQLFSAMEAEREFPPVLRLAFSRDPRALEGWRLMSPIQRRAQLIAIFYYRSPDARSRRTEKVVASAVALAEKKSAR